jgi:hypothetical protein
MDEGRGVDDGFCVAERIDGHPARVAICGAPDLIQ